MVTLIQAFFAFDLPFAYGKAPLAEPLRAPCSNRSRAVEPLGLQRVDRSAANGDDTSMDIALELDIQPGITAVIGSGGKTTLLTVLARRLEGRVVLATSTHIRPFPGIPTVEHTPLPARVSCVASFGNPFKLSAPQESFEALAQAARYVLVEADGSKMLPLKAHASHEPVIPKGSTQTICVVGASGFGRPVAEVVHRPEIFCRIAGCALDDAATPELVARVIRAENLATRLVINQADTPELLELAHELGRLAGLPYWAGSLRDFV